MASARQTTDHDEIQEWVESRDGHPAEVEGTGVLRIDFEPDTNSLEHIPWERFFEIFEESNLAFLYDPEGHMVKFIERESARDGDDTSDGRGTRSTRGRKKSSTARKKSTSARKSTAKKSTSRTSTARKSSAKKSSAKKSSAKKSSAKKSSARKSSAKKSSAKKSSAKKSAARKSTAKKSGAKKTGAKKSGGRKYGKKAQRKISKVMHEYGEGSLKSGRSGRSVKNRKQAIAIGISEARREGDKVPKRKKSPGRGRKKS